MHAPRLTVALVALLAVAGPASAELAVSFLPPGQATGEATASRAEWVLILLEPGMAAGYSTGPLGDVSVVNHTRIEVGVNLSPGAHLPEPEHVMDGDVWRLAPGSASMQSRPGFSALFLSGHNLSLTLLDSAVELEQHPAGRCISSLVETDVWVKEESRSQDICPRESGVAVVARPGRDGLRFQLSAGNASIIEAYGLDVDCPTKPCPNGGSRTFDERTWPDGSKTWTAQRTFEEWRPTEPVLIEGSGEAAIVILGSSRMDVAINGWLRLPLATSDCNACVSPVNQTLQAQGELVLSDLSLGPDGRLSSVIQGEAAVIRFDEQAVDPASLGLGPKIVGVAAAGVAVAAGIIGFLLSQRRPKLPHNPRRDLVLETITRSPGTSLNGLRRATKLGAGNLRWHLKLLEGAGEIVSKPHGNTIRYFENHGRYNKTWRKVTVLNDPDLQRLHQWLQDHPGSTQADIIRQASQVWNWPRSSCQDRLRDLQQGGLLRVHSPNPRRVAYFAES